MPFIPHTKEDIKTMLECIGVDNIENLFDEIPKKLCTKELQGIPQGLSELQVDQLMAQHAKKNQHGLCFIGAGAYEHYIPAAVWDIASRGEFLTAYTPYQAEASQGTLQLLYEYQTMMAHLTGMDVANASLYDGATALAEAVLMTMRCQRRLERQRILIASTLHPAYRQVLNSIVGQHDVDLLELNYDEKKGAIDIASLEHYQQSSITAIIIQHPNFFGCYEQVDQLTDWAKAQNALVIACVNPMSLAVLKEPGQWGETGADIVCGEAQPFGVPLASGGPYAGFLCCVQQHVRQLPGRLVGRTADQDGNPGYVLTLQAREQHIRRAKATSNICTNQGLLVTAATIYLSLLGPEGLRRVAHASHANTQLLVERLTKINGVELVFQHDFFHEALLRIAKPLDHVLTELQQRGIQGGYAVTHDYPELHDCLLVCATETKSEEDIFQYATALQNIM